MAAHSQRAGAQLKLNELDALLIKVTKALDEVEFAGSFSELHAYYEELLAITRESIDFVKVVGTYTGDESGANNANHSIGDAYDRCDRLSCAFDVVIDDTLYGLSTELKSTLRAVRDMCAFDHDSHCRCASEGSSHAFCLVCNADRRTGASM